MTESILRPMAAADLTHVKAVLDATGLFPAKYLDEMAGDYLNNPDSADIWFVYEARDAPVAFGYCAPERLTEGTWNLLAIAVHPDCQNAGTGSAMMRYIEAELTRKQQRVLLVETSGLPEYERTRQFYARNAYTQEARIRDFYKAGDDKIIFWKLLSAS
jgi:ribosomal protein S18 acetylase RimI-like enzyme